MGENFAGRKAPFLRKFRNARLLHTIVWLKVVFYKSTWNACLWNPDGSSSRFGNFSNMQILLCVIVLRIEYRGRPCEVFFALFHIGEIPRSDAVRSAGVFAHFHSFSGTIYTLGGHFHIGAPEKMSFDTSPGDVQSTLHPIFVHLFLFSLDAKKYWPLDMINNASMNCFYCLLVFLKKKKIILSCFCREFNTKSRSYLAREWYVEESWIFTFWLVFVNCYCVA